MQRKQASSSSVSSNTGPREDDEGSQSEIGRIDKPLQHSTSYLSFSRFSDQAMGSLLSNKTVVEGQTGMKKELFTLGDTLGEDNAPVFVSPGTRFNRQAHLSAPAVLMSPGDQAPRLPRRSSDPNFSPTTRLEEDRFTTLSYNPTISNKAAFKLGFRRQGSLDSSLQNTLQIQEGSVLLCSLSDDDGVHSDITKEHDSSEEDNSSHDMKPPAKVFKEPSLFPKETHPLKLTKTYARSNSPREYRHRAARERPEHSGHTRKRAKSWQELTNAKVMSDGYARAPRRGSKKEQFGKRARQSERRWSVEEAVKDTSFEEMLKTPIRSNKRLFDSDEDRGSTSDGEKEESPTSVEKIVNIEQSAHSRISKASQDKKSSGASGESSADDLLLAVEEISLGE